MTYEYVNETAIDENLKCSICNDPFQRPVHTQCDHTFCYACIAPWVSSNKSCPTCRSTISDIQELKAIKTRLVLNMLDSLPVKCKTCGSTNIERGNFEDHVKVCQRKSMHSYSCAAADVLCPWVGSKYQLSEHLSQCPYEQLRPVLSKILAENQQLTEQIAKLTEQFEKKAHKNEKQVQDKRSTITEVRPHVRTIVFASLLDQDKCGSVPDGFAGLNWRNARYTNEEKALAIRPRKRTERLSVFLHGYPCIIYNDWKNPLVISSTTHNFTLHACEVMSVHHPNETCTFNVIGRKNELPVYSKTISLQRDISQVIQFTSWTDVNKLELFIENSYFILTWIQVEQ
ncbi:unnamed protein product [Adineta ricciae]|uniref:RING-type domain-containing protein n=1 Tax=Adineta ricciae TaxID=249248 RepID=A0A814Q8W2_ADIRI|nr:unnamed protein product [Adineta ricciae]CAF1117188.1 unnamed protein product [Adineta ricciae]